ncbi:MAG TPA: HNH endonuclease signature motif containing protein [Allocoleopsis sp.]
MLHRTIIEKLIERDGNNCSLCGEPFFQTSQICVHYLISKIDGGTDDLENLILVCPRHNMLLGRQPPLLEVDFNRYLVEFMKQDRKFRNIQPEAIMRLGTKRIVVDIVAEELINNEWQKIFIESKTQYAYTFQRSAAVVAQLQSYHSVFTKEFNQIKLIFAFPGSLTKDVQQSFEGAGIEVWDLEYLARRFNSAIPKVDNPVLKLMLLAVTKKFKTTPEEELIKQLRLCLPGRNDWSKYQKLVGSILEKLFCPPLSKPISELSDSSRVNRRDFIFPNYNDSGFWGYLRSRYTADYIVVDAKNYKEKVKKKEALQIANYLKSYGVGLFGVIVCRNGADLGCIHTLRETWLIQQKLIIILTDNDLEQMLLTQQSKAQPEIIIQQKIEDFRLSL